MLVFIKIITNCLKQTHAEMPVDRIGRYAFVACFAKSVRILIEGPKFVTFFTVHIKTNECKASLLTPILNKIVIIK